MRIYKTTFVILAMAFVMIFAAQSVLLAGQNLTGWPITPGVQGSVKTKATFAAHDYTVPDGGGCQAVLMLRVRTKDSNTMFFYSIISDEYSCSPGDQPGIIAQFLNDAMVVGAICPDCDLATTYVHIKRVTDDYVNNIPRAEIADFELVLNEDPNPFLPSP